MLTNCKPVLSKYFRLIIFLIVCLLTVNSFGQKTAERDKFTLSGKLIGRDTGIIVLKYLDKSWKYVKDTVVLKQGRFQFTGSITEPTEAELLGYIKSNSFSDPNRVTLFLEPSAMKIDLREDDFVHAKISGSFTQTDFSRLKMKKEPFSKRSDSAKKDQQKLMKLLGNGVDSIALNRKIKELRVVILQMYSEIKNLEYSFIKSHPRSSLSPYLLQYFIGEDAYDLDSLKQIYNGFVTNVRSGRFGKQVDQRIKSKEASVVGNTALNFSAKDINEKVVELSQFKDKSYVLLDFWASWCGPCHEQAPYLKKLHEEFKDKGLELISISSDGNRDYWKDAIKKDGIGGWTNILMSDAHTSEKEKPLNLKFAIDALPTTILIDKNGVILYWKVGFNESTDALELKNKVEEHLK